MPAGKLVKGALARARQQGFDVDTPMFHGSTHGNIHDLDASGTNIESDWGPGFYTTSEPEDANVNYAGLGPDLRSRVTQRAEELADDDDIIDDIIDNAGIDRDTWDEYDYDEQAAHFQRIAESELVGDTPEGVVYPVTVNRENFAEIGGPNPTYRQGKDYQAEAREEVDRADYDDDDDYDEAVAQLADELQQYDDEGLEQQVSSALTSAFDGDEDATGRVMEDLYESLAEGELSLGDLDEAVRGADAYVYDESGEGMLSAGGVSARVLQELGYDGVVDHTVNDKFGRHMEGMGPGMQHAIAFPGGEQNVRSVHAEFDPDKRNSTNLLASRLLPGALTTAVAGSALVAPEESEAGVTRFVRNAGGLFEPESKRIATRYPKAKSRTEDPLTNSLVIDTDAMAQAGTLGQNIDELLKNPQLRPERGTPEQKAEGVRSQLVDNLLHLHGEFDPEQRDQAKLWYDGANKLARQYGERFGIPPESAAGAMAALSPQRDWYKNVSLAERTMDGVLNHAGEWTDEAKEIAKRIFKAPKYQKDLEISQTRPWQELTDEQKAMQVRAYDEAHNSQRHRIITPSGEFAGSKLKQDGSEAGTGWGSLKEIGKAISVIEDPSIANISAKMGDKHKVRNFYNNIIDPNAEYGDVTIDTHAVAADMYSPFSGKAPAVEQNFGTRKGIANEARYGTKGTYGIHADAYRDAAQQAGILPREMQSITWEAARGLFPDTYKTARDGANVSDIQRLWEDYSKGRASQQDIREAVYGHAGGVNNPTWYVPGEDIRNFKGGTQSSYAPKVAAGAAAGAAGASQAGTHSATSPLLTRDAQAATSALLTPGGMEHRVEPATAPWAGTMAQGIREGLEHVTPALRPFVPFAGALADWGDKAAYGEQDWYDKWLVGLDAL